MKLFGGLSAPQVVTASLISVLSYHQSDIWSPLRAFNFPPLLEISSRRSARCSGVGVGDHGDIESRVVLRLTQ